MCCVQVVIKEKVLELLLYFTKHEDEEVKTKAIIGLGKPIVFNMFYYIRFDIESSPIYYEQKCQKIDSMGQSTTFSIRSPIVRPEKLIQIFLL